MSAKNNTRLTHAINCAVYAETARCAALVEKRLMLAEAVVERYGRTEQQRDTDEYQRLLGHMEALRGLAEKMWATSVMRCPPTNDWAVMMLEDGVS